MKLEPVQLPEAAWRAACAKFDDFNYCQEWSYAMAMAHLRHSEADTLAFRHGDDIEALAAVRIRRLGPLRTGFALISRGPLVCSRRHPSGDHQPEVLELLRRRYVTDQRLTLRIVPPLCRAQASDGPAAPAMSTGNTQTGSPNGYTTHVLDLSDSLDDIRGKFHKKWRRHLKLSEKRNIQVDIGCNDSLFSRFISLFDELVDRKSFRPGLTPVLLQAAAADAGHESQYLVLVAHQGGVDLAAVILSLHGKTGTYLLGATSSAGLQSDASYLLQWKAIEVCHSRQLRSYDLGGVDPIANPGVYLFKRRMRGTPLEAPNPITFLPSGLLGRVSALGIRALGV